MNDKEEFKNRKILKMYGLGKIVKLFRCFPPWIRIRKKILVIIMQE